jgi:hypothetical protein
VTAATLTEAIAAIERERDHYETRHERETLLLVAGRRDSAEEADYTDGARWGLDLALSILRRAILREADPR